MFLNVLNLYGTGWFKCDRCECMFESAIIPSIIIRCPRCGRIIVNKETNEIEKQNNCEIEIIQEKEIEDVK